MKRLFLDDFFVDGQKLLAPDAGVSISYSDVEADSFRDESGYLHRIVTRHDVRTWGFSYSVLTKEEHDYLLALFRGKAVFEFVSVENGVAEALTCYCDKKSTSYYSRKSGLYKNLKFEIVEC